MSHTALCYHPPFRVVVETRGSGVQHTLCCERTYKSFEPARADAQRRHTQLEMNAPPRPHYPSVRVRLIVVGTGEDGAEYILKHWHDVTL